MSKSRVLFAVVLLAAAVAAQADVTVTPAVVSDYDWRGITQTAQKPALQVGVDYADPSGLYLGAWGSNLDFGPGDPQAEVDLKGGFTFGDAKDGFAYDVGAIYYTYVNKSDYNYPEIYAGLKRGWFSAKLSYSWDYNGTRESSYYLSTTGTVPLPQAFSLAGHIGYSAGNYWDRFYGGGYYDWSVGVTKKLGNFTVGLSFIDGSDLPSGRSKVFSTESRVVASLATTLPWSAD
jgi:uncharacterized protein (TIGR02001 family)